MGDSDMLKEIIEDQQRLERKFDGQQTWFQTLAQKVDELAKTAGAARGEMGEMRDLLADVHDDYRIIRRTVAGALDDGEKLAERVRLLEQRTTP
jgi:hypothetical protein